MNILISDTNFKVNQGYSYRSSNVSEKSDDNNSETIKEMAARVSAENSPAYMVSISSQGRAAVEAMQLSMNRSQQVQSAAGAVTAQTAEIQSAADAAASQTTEVQSVFDSLQPEDSEEYVDDDTEQTDEETDAVEDTVASEYGASAYASGETLRAESGVSAYSTSDSVAVNMVSYSGTRETGGVTMVGSTGGMDTEDTLTTDQSGSSMSSIDPEQQLRSGEIFTRSETEAELEDRTDESQPAAGMQAAIAAYSYQMAFSDGRLSFA